MILLLIFIVDVVGAFAIAFGLRARTRWSNARITLVSALPVTMIVGSLAAYGASLMSEDGQSTNLTVDVSIGVLTVYLIGLAVSYATVKWRRGASNNDISDVFS